MKLLWNPYRSVSLAFTCIGGQFSTGTFPRGEYIIREFYLSVTDWSGFFIYKIPGPVSNRITVYPGGLRRSSEISRSFKRTSENTVISSVLRNQEQFEARPYTAGDDPRRIHWKMLARHEELFIREGSGLLRDRQEILMVFDGGHRSGRSSLKDRNYFLEIDSTLRVMAGVLESLDEKGFSIWGVFPGLKGFLDLGTLSRKDRQSLFASIPPEQLKTLPASGGRSFGAVLLFSARPPDAALLEQMEARYNLALKNIILSPESVRIQRRGWSVVKA